MLILSTVGLLHSTTKKLPFIIDCLYVTCNLCVKKASKKLILQIWHRCFLWLLWCDTAWLILESTFICFDQLLHEHSMQTIIYKNDNNNILGKILKSDCWTDKHSERRKKLQKLEGKIYSIAMKHYNKIDIICHFDE